MILSEEQGCFCLSLRRQPLNLTKPSKPVTSDRMVTLTVPAGEELILDIQEGSPTYETPEAQTLC